MNRDYYNLYVTNISNKTSEESLVKYFSQFGKIESFTFLIKCYRRHNTAAMITFAKDTNIDYIVQDSQRIEFDNRNLFLRRTLPSNRPAFERFMSSNELLISLPSLSNDKQFNERNIRKYFSQYGSIVFCRMVIPLTTYLIDFVSPNNVDSAILEEPHFYNDKKLILRKYVSLNYIGLYHINKVLSNYENKIHFKYLKERIRRLNHTMEAIQFAQKVEIRLIKCAYEEKQIKLNKKQNEKLMNLNIDIQQMKENNNSLKLLLEQSRRTKQQIIDLYKTKLQQEQKRIFQLKEAIDLLKLF